MTKAEVAVLQKAADVLEKYRYNQLAGAIRGQRVVREATQNGNDSPTDGGDGA